jgi:hypothetical protein
MSGMSRFRAIAVIAGMVIFAAVMIAALIELNDWVDPAGAQQHWSDVVDSH